MNDYKYPIVFRTILYQSCQFAWFTLKIEWKYKRSFYIMDISEYVQSGKNESGYEQYKNDY